MKRDLILSVTEKDLDITFYKASDGKGGQKANKTSSACRIVHRASGAVGDSSTHRQQIQNRKEAFRRLNKSKKFKLWLKTEYNARLEGYKGIKEKVDKMMDEKNLKIEYLGEKK
jgi:protein subunit release factor B